MGGTLSNEGAVPKECVLLSQVLRKEELCDQIEKIKIILLLKVVKGLDNKEVHDWDANRCQDSLRDEKVIKMPSRDANICKCIAKLSFNFNLS